MISNERLQALQYQATHRGNTKLAVDKARKEGRDVMQAPNGPMVLVTALELQVLLAAYTQTQGEPT